MNKKPYKPQLVRLENSSSKIAQEIKEFMEIVEDRLYKANFYPQEDNPLESYWKCEMTRKGVLSLPCFNAQKRVLSLINAIQYFCVAKWEAQCIDWNNPKLSWVDLIRSNLTNALNLLKSASC